MVKDARIAPRSSELQPRAPTSCLQPWKLAIFRSYHLHFAGLEWLDSLRAPDPSYPTHILKPELEYSNLPTRYSPSTALVLGGPADRKSLEIANRTLEPIQRLALSCRVNPAAAFKSQWHGICSHSCSPILNGPLV